ncbi:MAG: adenylate/guanylate cyclase domain-containing protein, partial [Bacteroidales bacterium]|nr:adenylate/guanylate cyclase domain-containing protein [Bacteroidales bacterium]
FFIMTVSSLINILFVYFWQKHRVHIRYLEFFYSPVELRKRIFNLKVGKIKNRLWISSAMTTFFPVLIVIFYMVISITNVHDFLEEPPTEEQAQILIGKYESYFGDNSINSDTGIIYINMFDTYIMLIGTFSGIMISFFYLLLFIRWTTRDIVYPVRELLLNMQRTGRGEMESYSIVRTNDEIGELTEGYNEMSGRLKDYIENISLMNEANARFVPKQFLEYLGKDSIADIQLGDQVQKEMTVLFSDIRSFTSISEQMTPKENFNFLNNYLGYMEPVIRNNNGFIDKFMGDSIMALFPDNTEDAINAAIEMRIKLIEFNHIISQFGQTPIDSGIGIHTGSLMLGIVGGEGRMEGTVISDAVNLASRLEGLTKLYGSSIIITEETLIKISDPTSYHYRFLDIVKVKGKKEAV